MVASITRIQSPLNTEYIHRPKFCGQNADFFFILNVKAVCTYSHHCAFKNLTPSVAISISCGSVLLMHAEEMCVDIQFSEGLSHPEG
jgi:hypothetical protein